MSDRLSEIAEREKAATPGPWIEGGGRSDFAVVNPRLPHPSEHQVRYDGYPIAECEFYDTTAAAANCTFICEARADIPWLITNTQQALALIRSVRDGNGWKEIPVGTLNQIEAILLGDTNETENHDGK